MNIGEMTVLFVVFLLQCYQCTAITVMKSCPALVTLELQDTAFQLEKTLAELYETDILMDTYESLIPEPGHKTLTYSESDFICDS